MLKAWSALAESGCIPVPLWPELVRLAADRLEDGSVMVGLAGDGGLSLIQGLVLDLRVHNLSCRGGVCGGEGGK